MAVAQAAVWAGSSELASPFLARRKPPGAGSRWPRRDLATCAGGRFLRVGRAIVLWPLRLGRVLGCRPSRISFSESCRRLLEVRAPGLQPRPPRARSPPPASCVWLPQPPPGPRGGGSGPRGSSSGVAVGERSRASAPAPGKREWLCHRGGGGGLAPDAAASTGARPRRSASLRAESGTVTGTAAPVLHLDSETSPLIQGQERGAEP